MPSLAEVVAAQYGAWRLLRFDPAGMTWFDISIRGFWRSFFAAVPVAPAYAIFIGLDFARRAEPVDLGWAMLVSTIAYVCGWIAFPVAAIFITRLLGLTDRYVALIVAYNWASVPQTLLLLPPVLIEANGALPAQFASVLTMVVTIFVLLYQWFVTRTALATTALTATGIVFLEVLIGAFIDLTADSLI
ncbi:MAG: hypothetical protein ACE5H8_11915 [Alphaproteobacteria bacterium]